MSKTNVVVHIPATQGSTRYDDTLLVEPESILVLQVRSQFGWYTNLVVPNSIVSYGNFRWTSVYNGEIIFYFDIVLDLKAFKKVLHLKLALSIEVNLCVRIKDWRKRYFKAEYAYIISVSLIIVFILLQLVILVIFRFNNSMQANMCISSFQYLVWQQVYASWFWRFPYYGTLWIDSNFRFIHMWSQLDIS
jgi:hypothetical protein